MTKTNDFQEGFLKQAIQISEEKMLAGAGGPFGAVVVHDNQIVSIGYNQVTSTNDPTAHAEVVAIRNACKALNNFKLTDCTLYSSCEPCPMCLSAIYWSRIKTVYFANTKEDAASIGFDDEYIYQEIVKTYDQRDLCMIHKPLNEAKQAFQKWTEKADKIPY